MKSSKREAFMTWKARAFRIVFVGLVSMGQEASAGELVFRVSEGWNATRIVSDAPQTPILEFGDQFPLLSGELVFWGRIRDGRDGWALFSLQGDRLRTILAEGESSVSRYGEPNVKHHLHYRGGMEFLHRTTRIFAGRVLVISTEHKIAPGGSVYAWDGERLRGVLVEDEGTTLGGAGVIAGAFAWAASPDGEVFLTFYTKKPNPYTGWALYDAGRLRMLARSEEPLPGLPDIRATRLCGGGGGSVCSVWPFDGGQILTTFNFFQGNAELQTAIFLMSPVGSKRLLGLGDPLPEDPAKRIGWATLETAESPRSFMARLAPLNPAWKKGDPPQEATYAHCDPAGCRAVTKEAVEAAQRKVPVPWQSASFLRWSGGWREERPGTLIGRRDLEAVNGEQVIRLTPPDLLLADDATIRLVDGELPGAFVEGSYWDASAAKNGRVDIDKVKPKRATWFVAADDLAAGLQPPPVLRTRDGRSVSLADVLVRKGTAQVIARLGDGLYRLERTAERSSP